MGGSERRCRGPDEPSSAASAGLGGVQEAETQPSQSQAHKRVFRELAELGRKRPSTDPKQNVRKELDPDRHVVKLEIPIMTASGDHSDDLIE